MTSKVSVKGAQRQASLLTRPQLTTNAPHHPCKALQIKGDGELLSKEGERSPPGFSGMEMVQLTCVP